MKPYITIVKKSLELSAARTGSDVFLKLGLIPDVQLIYASPLACTRHRGSEFVELQRRGKLSFLMLDEIDVISGDYLSKIQEAAAEIALERSPSGIILVTGCQSALLSTDYALLSKEIEQETAVPVRVHDGCRLCGFDENAPNGDQISRLLFDFILPAEKSEQPSVNILTPGELDQDSELFSVLRACGVKQINALAAYRNREDYQAMGRAHFNIVTTPSDIPLGEHLEEKLGIPWACFGGVYGGEELSAAYSRLAGALGTDIDVSSFRQGCAERLEGLRSAAAGCGISVSGDAEMARWLIGEGFLVVGLRLPHKRGLTKEQSDWFAENAPELNITKQGRGSHSEGKDGRGRGGHSPGDGLSRGGGFGEGKGGRGAGKGAAASPLKLGFAGTMAVIEALEGEVCL